MDPNEQDQPQVADLFRPEWPSRPADPYCAGCGAEAQSVRGTDAKNRRFREMTGRDWPGALSLAVRRDRDTLGLSRDDVPERATFCLPCAVAYMDEFNRRLAETK